MHRFYYAGPFTDPRVELTGDEAHHLIRVLRLSPGDQVELFDGCGRAAIAEISEVQKKAAWLDVVTAAAESPRRRPTMTLLTASPKSDRLRWLVEKATELEVDRLMFVQTHHSVVHPGPGKLKKMQSTILAACKQSRRNDFMQIDPPKPWEAVVAQVAKTTERLFIATPAGASIADHGTGSGDSGKHRGRGRT